MKTELLHDLMNCETDVEGALRRFCDNEALYIKCLSQFLEDRTMSDLEKAMQAQAWDEAFTAAHALKGVTGNMGFIPLFHASAELVILIRTGKIQEAGPSFLKLKRCYDQVASVISRHCGTDRKEEAL